MGVITTTNLLLKYPDPSDQTTAFDYEEFLNNNFDKLDRDSLAAYEVVIASSAWTALSTPYVNREDEINKAYFIYDGTTKLNYLHFAAPASDVSGASFSSYLPDNPDVRDLDIYICMVNAASTAIPNTMWNLHYQFTPTDITSTPVTTTTGISYRDGTNSSTKISIGTTGITLWHKFTVPAADWVAAGMINCTLLRTDAITGPGAGDYTNVVIVGGAYIKFGDPA